MNFRDTKEEATRKVLSSFRMKGGVCLKTVLRLGYRSFATLRMTGKGLMGQPLLEIS